MMLQGEEMLSDRTHGDGRSPCLDVPRPSRPRIAATSTVDFYEEISTREARPFGDSGEIGAYSCYCFFFESHSKRAIEARWKRSSAPALIPPNATFRKQEDEVLNAWLPPSFPCHLSLVVLTAGSLEGGRTVDPERRTIEDRTNASTRHHGAEGPIDARTIPTSHP